MNTVLAITSPASEAQIKFLRSLLAEKLADPAAALAWLDTHMLSKATASAKITEYKAMPTVNRAAQLDEGMYKVGEDIFKVYRTRDKDILVTKQLIEGVFEYTGRAPLKFITVEHRMTLDEAKAYGKVTGTCCVCGRKLTNEASIADGIGPVCSGKV
jgi:hypothetical protein